MILIIEDNQQIAEWVKIYFERAGFLVEIAPDGKVGLSLARVLNPALIVLDLMLPHIDGVMVCHTLRREYGRSHYHDYRQREAARPHPRAGKRSTIHKCTQQGTSHFGELIM